jgi:hypothetical protein
MSTLVIRSNSDTVSDVLIRDLGYTIPAGGGQVTLTANNDITNAQNSANLDIFINDGSFPGGGDPSANTLILNDGVSDIPPGEAGAFFGAAPMVGATAGTDGQQGLATQPVAGDNTKFLRGDATWQDVASSLTVKETDGTPTVVADEIRVPNGSLTDEGAGAITLGYETPSGAATQITSHSGVADAHHTRYTDNEAAAASDYAGRFELASIGTGDITLNKWGWWWDTNNSQLYMVRNRAGTLYAVEVNPL